MIPREVIKALIEVEQFKAGAVLNPLAESKEWSVQGFGFLRFYLPESSYRLHVWHSSLRYNPMPSMIHDHLQWHFTSKVMSGRVINRRYDLVRSDGEPFHYAYFKPGMEGEMLKEMPVILLRARRDEVYRTGESYSQRNDEIHESIPDDGTVTLIKRDRTNMHDLTRIFWPKGTQWLSAIPRPATNREVHAVLTKALDMWEDA